MMAILGLLTLSSILPLLPFPHGVFGYTPHSPIFANGNRGFTVANGVTSGNGSASNPYVFEGWDINASSRSSSSTFGIEIMNTDEHFIIRSVRVHDGFTGIYLRNATNGQVENSELSNNRGYGINAIFSKNILLSDSIFNADLDGGILIQYSSNTLVSGNTITKSGSSIGGSAILVEWSNVTSILGNTASGNSGGIGVYWSTRASVNYNRLQNNTYGISLLSSSYVNVTQNGVSNNGGGILLQSSNNTFIFYNLVSYSTRAGISLILSNDASIFANNVSRNLYGIMLGGARINVYRNNLVNNSVQASDGGGRENSWNSSYPVGGNYWSNYSGVDQCSGPSQNLCTGPDGIGDTPYVINSNTRDNYPLMTPVSIRDTYPPHWPPGSSLDASNVTLTSLVLTWTPATDNMEVEFYKVYQGNTLLAVLPTSIHTYSATGLKPATTYSFKVEAGDVAGNWSTDGPSQTITTPAPDHNVAVVSVRAAPTSIVRGATISISVIVLNQGNVAESFRVTTYYNDTLISSLTVTDLQPNANESLSFQWDTAGVGPGTYSVKAVASPVPGENDTSNNARIGDIVTIAAPPNAPPVLTPIGSKSVEKGKLLTFTISAADPDGDHLSFSLEPGAPVGASITPSGVFTWTPSIDEGPGSFPVTIIVSDGSLTDSETIQVTVLESSHSSGTLTFLYSLRPFWWIPLTLPVPVALLLFMRRKKKNQTAVSSHKPAY